IDPSRPLDAMTPPKRKSALTKIAKMIRERLNTGVSADCDLLNPGVLARGGQPAGPHQHGPSFVTTATVSSDSIDRVTEIQVNYRLETEAKGADQALQLATKVRFIALTYKTLRLAVTNGIKQLSAMQDVELAVYSLPILRHWHPTLRNDHD